VPIGETDSEPTLGWVRWGRSCPRRSFTCTNSGTRRAGTAGSIEVVCRWRARFRLWSVERRRPCRGLGQRSRRNRLIHMPKASWSAGRAAELRRLQTPLPHSVRLSDDQDGTVDRTRNRHRLPRRARSRLTARATHRRRGLDDRPRDRADTDRAPREGAAPREPATRRGRRRDRPSRTGPTPARLRRRWSRLSPHRTTTAVCVILAWIIGWTALGAWRMATRDA
jgi:hypothetical protein